VAGWRELPLARWVGGCGQAPLAPQPTEVMHGDALANEACPASGEHSSGRTVHQPRTEERQRGSGQLRELGFGSGLIAAQSAHGTTPVTRCPRRILHLSPAL
jgi:hypothetical protein